MSEIELAIGDRVHLSGIPTTTGTVSGVCMCDVLMVQVEYDGGRMGTWLPAFEYVRIVP